MSQLSIAPLSHQQLLGLTDDHLCLLPEHATIKVHIAALQPLNTVIAAARQAGFKLRVASGFRDYYRQLMIWNNKSRGLRPTYDDRGQPLDITALSPEQKVYAILRWSALPGASRHHWGSDCDIYDAAAVSDDYPLQLQPEEYLGDGPFAPMMCWLQEYLEQPDTPDFYRPYFDTNAGVNTPSQGKRNQGVAPEPWHISYRPVSAMCAQQLSLSLLREQLQQLASEDSIDDKLTMLECLDDIYARFIDLTDNINSDG